MVNPIPNSVMKVWKEWNVRGVILLSLSLQTILIISAPCRKRTANKLFIFLIWSSYLLADWAAYFAVGHIASTKSDDTCEDVNQDDDLKAFWVPFLLVHLGGPDSLTSLSLEDNKLWFRHLLGLLIQVIVTVYIFIQTVPGNRLWIPTVLMFLAGITKYVERTRSLYLASLDIFRESIMKKPDPGPNYIKLMEEYSSKREAGLPTRFVLVPEPDRAFSTDANAGELNELEVVQSAYHFFNTFKGLIVNTIISFRECNESREFFFRRNAIEAYMIIGAELNFIYEALFTKVIVVHTLKGYIFRALSFCAVVAALGLFFTAKKNGFREFDVRVSYTLLFGAIFLDGVSLFMFVFSEWTVAILQKHKALNRVFKPMFTRYLRLKNPLWFRNGFFEYVWAGLFGRWSESISGYNFITYCQREYYGTIREHKPDGSLYAKAINFLHFINFNLILDHIIDYVGARNLVDELKCPANTMSRKLILELWEFIFRELRNKAIEAEDEESFSRICSAQGASVLQENNWGRQNDEKIQDLFPYVEDKAYDESLLLWHIATELCYHDEDNPSSKAKNGVPAKYKKFSKILSDYMLYLMVMKPALMPAVAEIAEIRLQDTSAEARKIFSRRSLGRKDIRLAFKEILEVNTDVEPVNVKGNRSKSVLFDACILAKKLRKFETNTKWKIISAVWVEKLSFAASHCLSEAHVQQLTIGGELITFVWLLMAHFGLGEQFQISERLASAILIVGK